MLYFLFRQTQKVVFFLTHLIAIAFFKLSKWKPVGTIPKEVKKAILIGVPHNSNWDAPLGLLWVMYHQLPMRYLIKREAMFFPLNIILKLFGAMPIDRNKKNSITKISTVAQVVQVFNKTDKLVIAISPEGTRKRVKQWKTGFYYMAVEANVPIALGFFDYNKKEVGIMGLFYPTGDIEKDLPKIQAYYKNIRYFSK